MIAKTDNDESDAPYFCIKTNTICFIRRGLILNPRGKNHQVILGRCKISNLIRINRIAENVIESILRYYGLLKRSELDKSKITFPLNDITENFSIPIPWISAINCICKYDKCNHCKIVKNRITMSYGDYRDQTLTDPNLKAQISGNVLGLWRNRGQIKKFPKISLSFWRK